MHLQTLTALRGIAALVVVLFHLNVIWYPLVQKGSFVWVQKGYLMVDFFFILSGFILVHVYGPVFSKSWVWPEYGRFLKARFARIYPLHLLSLLAMVGLAVYLFHDKPMDPFSKLVYDYHALPFHVFLLQGMHTLPFLSWNFPSWSISTEWWTYLLFPVLMWVYNRPGRWADFLLPTLGLLGYGLVYVFFYPMHVQESPFPVSPGYSMDVTYDYGFFRSLSGFLLGMWAYKMCSGNRLQSLLSNAWSWWVALVVLGLLAQNGLSDWKILPLFVVLLWASVFGTGGSKRLLESRPLVFLGDVSYSIYLWHGPLLIVFSLLDPAFPTVAAGPFRSEIWLLVFFGALFAVASASYFWFEKPARTFLKSRSLG